MTGPIVWMTVVGVVYFVGVVKVRRGDWQTHKKLMWFGFGMDMALTAYLELFRGAIEKALGWSSTPFHGNSHLLAVHVTFAVELLILYVFTLVIGTRGMRYLQHRERGMHKVLGYVSLALFALSYITAPGFVIEWLIGK